MNKNIKIAKELIKLAKELTFEQQDQLLIDIQNNNLEPKKRAQAIQYFVSKGGVDLYDLVYRGCNLLPNEKEYVLDKILNENVIDSAWLVQNDLKDEKIGVIREKILNYLCNNEYAKENIIEAIAYDYLTEQELSKWGKLIVNRMSKEQLKEQIDHYNNYLHINNNLTYFIIDYLIK